MRQSAQPSQPHSTTPTDYRFALLPCAIIGFTPSQAGFHSLLVATMREGDFRYVGQVAFDVLSPVSARCQDVS